MTQTSASFYVLLALSRGPAHGLGIADDVAALTDGEVLLGPGTLYRCLKDLTRAGAIERVDVEDPPGVTHRKYYRITSAGLKSTPTSPLGNRAINSANSFGGAAGHCMASCTPHRLACPARADSASSSVARSRASRSGSGPIASTSTRASSRDACRIASIVAANRRSKSSAAA